MTHGGFFDKVIFDIFSFGNDDEYDQFQSGGSPEQSDGKANPGGEKPTGNGIISEEKNLNDGQTNQSKEHTTKNKNTNQSIGQDRKSNPGEQVSKEPSQEDCPCECPEKEEKPGFFSKIKGFFEKKGEGSNVDGTSYNFKLELHEPNKLYKRVIIILFVFILAVYLASVTLKSKKLIKKITKLNGESANPDLDFEHTDESNITRWRRVMQLILVFIAFIIFYFLCIIVVAIIIAYYYFSVTSKNPKAIKPLMLSLFFEFEMDGKMYNLKFLYGIIILIMIVSMIWFMIYYLIVKSYLTRLAYAQFVKTGKAELMNPTKFVMYYGIYIILIVVFYIFLFTLYYLSLSSLAFVVFIYLISAIMFMMLIYRYTFERSPKKIAILWFVYTSWTIAYFFIMS